MLKYIIVVSENSAEINEIHTADCPEVRNFSDVRTLDSFNNSHEAKEYAEEAGFDRVHQCPHCCSEFF
ncbi:MAG: hypothetical protein ACRCU6_04230 [Fusobacteriaceae bacterium]